MTTEGNKQTIAYNMVQRSLGRQRQTVGAGTWKELLFVAWLPAVFSRKYFICLLQSWLRLFQYAGYG